MCGTTTQRMMTQPNARTVRHLIYGLSRVSYSDRSNDLHCCVAFNSSHR